jgi:carbon catabolite-derepressing protein kinase
MDLQLYRVDNSNYLVDFRNIGYYMATTGQPLPENHPALQSSVPLSEAEGKVQSYMRPSGSKLESIGGVSGPFHFLEMACQLIAELAS